MEIHIKPCDKLTTIVSDVLQYYSYMWYCATSEENESAYHRSHHSAM